MTRDRVSSRAKPRDPAIESAGPISKFGTTRRLSLRLSCNSRIASNEFCRGHASFSFQLHLLQGKRTIARCHDEAAFVSGENFTRRTAEIYHCRRKYFQILWLSRFFHHGSESARP